MGDSANLRSISRDTATRLAQLVVVVILVAGFAFVAREAYRTGSVPLGPSEITTTTRNTTEQKKTAKGTEVTERRELTTASKDTVLERVLSQPGLVLVRLLLVVLVAFLFGAAAQRILLGEFALKLGPLELAPLLPAPTDNLLPVPATVTAAFQVVIDPTQAAQVQSIQTPSGVMALLEQIQGPGLSDYAVIDLGIGRSWLTTRLFMFAILLRRMRGLRTFVFVETRDGVEQRFIGVAAPEIVRWRLALEYPWLESTFAEVYCRIPSPEIRSDTGALDVHVAGTLIAEFMQHPVIQADEVESEGEWERLPSAKWEHARWINRALLERILDLAPARSSVVDAGDLLAKARTLAILEREGEFVALVDDRLRFQSLVDRQALLEAVARRLVAASPRATTEGTKIAS